MKKSRSGVTALTFALFFAMAVATGCATAHRQARQSEPPAPAASEAAQPDSAAGGARQNGGIDRARIVAAHNKWRAAVGVGPLSYSTELEASAQAWADNLKKTNHCQMRHSNPGGKYGENLYWASALVWTDGRREMQNVTADMPVDSWGSEKADYDHASNACKPGTVCGHYTQVVWKTTEKVGCAYAVCEDSKEQVWVCQYQPAGNWVGRNPY